MTGVAVDEEVGDIPHVAVNHMVPLLSAKESDESKGIDVVMAVVYVVMRVDGSVAFAGAVLAESLCLSCTAHSHFDVSNSHGDGGNATVSECCRVRCGTFACADEACTGELSDSYDVDTATTGGGLDCD